MVQRYYQTLNYSQVAKEFDWAIANFQPFILDEMKTIWPYYLQKSVPYVTDELTWSSEDWQAEKKMIK